MAKFWSRNAPTECDIDGTPIVQTFIDGRTRSGQWANMCPRCARVNGIGLGLGKGQQYEKQDDGRFRKVDG